MTSIKSHPQAVSSEKSSFQVRDGFEQCLALYKTLLRYLGKKDCRVVSLRHVDVQRALEEYGRLKIWGQQTKATLLPQASATHECLDLLLRHESQIRENLLEILGQISYQLGLAISITRKGSNASLNPSDQELASTLDSSSEYMSDSCSEGDNEPRPRVPKIEVLMSHVFEQIRLLYHLGSLLRRHGLAERHLKSSNNASLSVTELYDLQHVEEKLRQWRGDDNNIFSVTPKEEKGVTEEDVRPWVSEVDLKSLISILSRRFAKANSQRREQFQYWTKHPYQAPPDKTSDHQLAVYTESIDRDNVDQPFIVDTDATMRASEETGARPIELTPMAHRFSTVTKPAVFETESTHRPRTIYAGSVVAGKSTTKVPPVPTHSEAQFQCPYCRMNLDGSMMKDRMAWKRHVLRDLRPYSCTFAQCSTPDKLYATRHDWMCHEMQMHRRSWNCAECDLVLLTKESMTTHLMEAHQNTWTLAQLPVLLDMSERPTDEDTTLACPLCPNELSLERLMKHLAEHMEEISLIALPRYTDDEEDPGCGTVAGLNSGGVRSSRLSASNSSLDYSEMGFSMRQESNLGKYETLAESEVPSSEDKISSWYRTSAESEEHQPTDTQPFYLVDYQSMEQDYQYVVKLSSQISEDQPSKILYLRNLTTGVSEDDLKAAFSGLKGYKRLLFHLFSGLPNNPICFIEFDDVGSAVSAFCEMKSYRFPNDAKGGIRLAYYQQTLRSRIYVSVLEPDEEDIGPKGQNPGDVQRDLIGIESRIEERQSKPSGADATHVPIRNPKNDTQDKGPPFGARWTKIRRSLAGLEALTRKQEQFRELDGYFLVFRVLGIDEVYSYVANTSKLSIPCPVEGCSTQFSSNFLRNRHIRNWISYRPKHGHLWEEHCKAANGLKLKEGQAVDGDQVNDVGDGVDNVQASLNALQTDLPASGTRVTSYSLKQKTKGDNLPSPFFRPS